MSKSLRCFVYHEAMKNAEVDVINLHLYIVDGYVVIDVCFGQFPFEGHQVRRTDHDVHRMTQTTRLSPEIQLQCTQGIEFHLRQSIKRLKKIIYRLSADDGDDDAVAAAAVADDDDDDDDDNDNDDDDDMMTMMMMMMMI